MNSQRSFQNNPFTTKLFFGVMFVALLSSVTGCDQNKDNQPKASVSHEKASKQEIQKPFTSLAVPTASNNRMVVTSLIDAGQYLYIEGVEKGVKTWIAASRVPVKIGDRIEYETGQTMVDFYSKTLDRTFEKIIFSNLVLKVNKDGTVEQNLASHNAVTSAMPENPHKNGLPTTLPEASDISVTKAEGGYTIEELFAMKGKLNGQTVKVRGLVVKFLPGIMQRNWLHLQDGSGIKGTNDLTVTTQEFIDKGETVVLEGKLVMDRDFGQGYAYALIMEDAVIVSK